MNAAKMRWSGVTNRRVRAKPRRVKGAYGGKGVGVRGGEDGRHKRQGECTQQHTAAARDAADLPVRLGKGDAALACRRHAAGVAHPACIAWERGEGEGGEVGGTCVSVMLSEFGQWRRAVWARPAAVLTHPQPDPGPVTVARPVAGLGMDWGAGGRGADGVGVSWWR